MNYRSRYKKIIDNLVKKSFLEIKGYNIIPVEVPRFFPFLSFSQKGFGRFYIITNKNFYRKLSNIALKGAFAHELCHIVLDHRYWSGIGDLFHNFIKFLGYVFNAKFSREIETKIDREAIKRGYAKCLLVLRKEGGILFSPKFVASFYSRGYLTPKQIKSYAKKIGKGK